MRAAFRAGSEFGSKEGVSRQRNTAKDGNISICTCLVLVVGRVNTAKVGPEASFFFVAELSSAKPSALARVSDGNIGVGEQVPRPDWIAVQAGLRTDQDLIRAMSNVDQRNSPLSS